MAVRVSGVFIVYNRIPELIAAVEAVSKSRPKEIADKIAASARVRAPVDTGFLRSSIGSRSVEAGKTAEVFAGADYAAYVEYGTYKMAAQPFLEPAVNEYEAEFFGMFGPVFSA